MKREQKARGSTACLSGHCHRYRAVWPDERNARCSGKTECSMPDIFGHTHMFDCACGTRRVVHTVGEARAARTGTHCHHATVYDAQARRVCVWTLDDE